MKIGPFMAGFVLIIVGMVLFLGKIGSCPFIFTHQLYKFWPVLLILLGISHLWGGVIPRLLGIVLVVVLVCGILALLFLCPAVNFVHWDICAVCQRSQLFMVPL
ncbi:MAG: LiaF transmembrane domain-containing protein [Dethiobacteria bacterium]|jgi:uncharacterized membrane protein